MIKSLLNRDVRLSLDASSLVKEILPLIKNKNVVITPHAGEFKRLFGEIPSENKVKRIQTVEKYAKKYSITILLKGQIDIISNGTKTYTNVKNTPAMTVGGTGDVLSGLTAGFLSRNRNALESASSAAFVNGLSGKITQKQFGLHLTATDLIENLPYVLKPFDKIK